MAHVVRGTVAKANIGNLAQRTRNALNTHHVGRAYEHRLQISIGASMFIVFVGVPLAFNQVHKYKVKVRFLRLACAWCALGSPRKRALRAIRRRGVMHLFP